MYFYTMLFQANNTQQIMVLGFINVTGQLDTQVWKALRKHLNCVFLFCFVFSVLN